MLKPDFAEFRALLDRCAAVYGKKPPDDALVQTYWIALRDVSLGAVTACANLHLKRGKFFPKPAELRPKSEMPSEPTRSDGSFEAAVARNVRNWEIQLRECEALAKWHLLGAYLARVDLEDPSSTIYAERMNFCRDAAQRLLTQFGPEWCRRDPHCMHAASRLLGGRFIERAEAPAAARTQAA